MRNPHGLLPRHFVAVDIETTGLASDYDEIVELAALRVDTACDTHLSFSTLLKTRSPIPPASTAIHGITDEMVAKDGRCISQAILEFYDFIGHWPIVVHNASFDIPFIKREFKEHKLKLENEVSCTLNMARRAFPGLETYKLEYLAQLSGHGSEGSHRALADCFHTARLYLACVQKLKAIK